MPPNPSTIRVATAQDASSIAALIDAAYMHYIPVIGSKPRPMMDDHAARTARGGTFVVEEDGKIGAVISLDDEGDALHIYNIAVHPDVQGRGLARRLIAFAEETARKRGAARLTLYTNALMTRNREMYAHFGFIEDGTEESNGHRVVHMHRPVPAP